GGPSAARDGGGLSRDESPVASHQSPVDADSSPSGGGGPSAARDGGGLSPSDEDPVASAPPTGDTPPEPEPPAPPEPVSASPTAPSGEVTLSEFSAAWPVVVARIRSDFGARRHAFVRVAEPLSVSGGVAILTLPTHQHFHLEQLNADDQLLQALEAITAEVLGCTVNLQFRSDDDTAPVAADEGEADEREPTRAPEPEQLDEGIEREKPEDLIVDMLGGTVVEE
ncbi:MAG: hypothetical protein WCC01_12135, partial [Acidimicrobiia bacterium]